MGLILLSWIIGLVLIRLLVALRLEIEPAENTAFVVMLVMMNGGQIVARFDSLGYLILIVTPALAAWLLVRMSGKTLITALIWGSAIAIAAGPVIALVESLDSGGGPSLVKESEGLAVDLVTKPDIFLVVFDGYPGIIAAAQDGLDSGVVDVVSELETRGFQVPSSSWTSFWATMLSIPSLVQMEYPVMDDQWRGLETKKRLQEILSGGGNLVEGLRHQGYRTHMVESGWSGAACGQEYDSCVPSPLIDEATYLILKKTVAWSFLQDSPGPYVLGTLAGFEWMLESAPALSASPEPDFVFMHVVSPHAPYLLSDDCSADLTFERAGTGFNVAGVPEEARARFLEEQIDCMDRFMVRFADVIEPDDIVVFVSDHGTDRRYQANPAVVNWDRLTIVERMNNFLALRMPEGCSIGEEVVVPNVLRHVLECLSSSPVEALPERMWVNPMVELDPDVVDELMSMRATSG